jgi:uncharacterized protein (DUF305 family)
LSLPNPTASQLSRSASFEGADDTYGDEEPSVSDATIERFYRVIVVSIALVLLVVAFAGMALWATSGDDTEQPMGAVDIGFLQDMLDHHDQALLIAEAYLDGNPDGAAAPYANEVVLFQTRDIARMEEWLAEAGLERGVPDRQAMIWMSEPSTVNEMPGMQDPSDIAALAAARGPEADARFFSLMSDHHLGGVHMADFAADNATTERIRDFAAAVSYNQSIEVVEYDGAVERLGLGSL